jgi:cell wall-associated NlpC family hydrolase
MRRFIYSPEVIAYIRSEEAGVVFDVTKDIISGSVNRRLDATSDATLVLQNKFGLYTRKFKPMDRIAIFMRRIGDPMLVFSGYLDEAPFYQMFPAPVTIQASCTIKLLQNTYFDPGLPFMSQWFHKFGWIYNPESGSVTDPFFGFGNYDMKTKSPKGDFHEGNLARLIATALNEIGGWPKNHIFIRSIPSTFIKTVGKLMKAEALEDKQDYQDILDRMQVMLGIGEEGVTPPGSDGLPLPSGGNVSPVQLASVARSVGFKGDGLVTAVAVSLAESSGNSNAMNYNTNGTYDVGLWQINTVHTSGGGGGLAAPPGGVGTLKMPKDYNAVKSSLPAGVQSFIGNCFNPKFNAQQAYSISSGGKSFTPWSTFNNGSYRSHMVEAAKAVKTLTNKTLPGAVVTPETTATTQWANTTTKPTSGKTVGGFIQFCKKALDTPYKWGGTDPFHGGADCSGFVSYMYQHYWGLKAAPPTTNQVTLGHKVDIGTIRPGDLVFFDFPGDPGGSPGHVGIWVGNGKFIHDPHTGDVVKISDFTGSYKDNFVAAVRLLPDNVQMGNIDSSSVGAVGAGTGLGSQVQDPTTVARTAAWFSLQLPTSDTLTSVSLTGKRALANDVPLFDWIKQMCASGGRRFCSMPNGDFLAFFPDYFNDFDRTPYFIIRPIEIIDLQIQVSDRDLITHVFATGTPFSQPINILDRMFSQVASVTEPGFDMFINVSESKKTKAEKQGKKKSKKGKFNAEEFLKHYGARPFSLDLPDIRHPVLLWMAAWMEFQKHWANQFGTTGSFTFMPELLPGGIVNFDNKITMFVESVTHTFDLESGFTTTAELNSPAAVNKNDKRFGSMVLAGGNFGVAEAIKEDKSIAKDAGPRGPLPGTGPR